jgi:hypothetical protein
MPENTRLSGSIDQIELGSVEREATPKLLMKLVFSSILLFYHFRIPSRFLRYSVSVALDPPFTIGVTKQSYSQKPVGIRITSRSMRP